MAANTPSAASCASVSLGHSFFFFRKFGLRELLLSLLSPAGARRSTSYTRTTQETEKKHDREGKLKGPATTGHEIGHTALLNLSRLTASQIQKGGKEPSGRSSEPRLQARKCSLPAGARERSSWHKGEGEKCLSGKNGHVSKAKNRSSH